VQTGTCRFGPPNESRSCCQLSVGDVPPFVAIDQKIGNFLQRAHRNAQKLRELFVTETAEAFRDVARRRSGGVLTLIAVFEVSNDVRLRNYFEDQSSQFVGELPGNEFCKFLGHLAG
jgi:hypothetical protein